MIRDCDVIINNDVVTVVRFCDVDVQLPSIRRSAKTVRVCYDGKKYFVVDNNINDSEVLVAEAKPKKQRTKKTTTEARVIRDAE